MPSVITYELDRTLTLPSCPWEVALRPTVEFKPVEMQPDEEVTCSELPFQVTTIHVFFTGSGIPLYSNSALMEKFSEAQRRFRLYIASEPQSQCVSVPVFTGASRSRLYFGQIYNTTGYYFLGGYAFTGKCACEDNACCGKTAIDEYLNPIMGNEHVYGYVYFGPKKPDNFYGLEIASKQQFYIAGIAYRSNLS
ncbi:unnamed protein product [Cylicocyclus nassatus]|uniref:Uncharacterized protein n=1 Tax=Cylicocyclus nassatus TaxID=53992 RepID=A0AA36DTR5_CYLNA|nr:unnamed protein product [Cylicocyclus nassatus]